MKTFGVLLFWPGGSLSSGLCPVRQGPTHGSIHRVLAASGKKACTAKPGRNSDRVVFVRPSALGSKPHGPSSRSTFPATSADLVGRICATCGMGVGKAS